MHISRYGLFIDVIYKPIKLKVYMASDKPVQI